MPAANIVRDPAAITYDPDNPTTWSEAGRDLMARWLPSVDQYAAAVAILDAMPHVHAVLAPIALPGKASSVWTVGQPVEYPDGLWLAMDRDDSYRTARNAAADAADRYLGDRDGEVAYAVIRRLGPGLGANEGVVYASVFDDIRMSRVPASTFGVVGDDADVRLRP